MYIDPSTREILITTFESMISSFAKFQVHLDNMSLISLPGSTVNEGTSLSAVVVVGSTSKQEEVIDGCVDSIVAHETSLPYSVKGLPSAPTEEVGSRVQGEVAIAFSPGADVKLVVQEAIQDNGHVVALPKNNVKMVVPVVDAPNSPKQGRDHIEEEESSIPTSAVVPHFATPVENGSCDLAKNKSTITN